MFFYVSFELMVQDKIENNKMSPIIDMAEVYSRVKCKSLCRRYNDLSPEMLATRQGLLRQILGKTGLMYYVEQPFMCDYGKNITIGECFYYNNNLLILDAAKVIFGNNVLVGPNCSFYTSIHPIDAIQRQRGVVKSLPITVGDNVWICGNVTVLAGVTIGENSVIGAGSVVNKNIPPNTLAIGNPCEVVKVLK